jgi:hypothetical protein
VRFFLLLFCFPIFIFSCKPYYELLTMLTYHISILYSLGCALPVLTEVVRVILFAYWKKFSSVFLIFPVMFFSLYLRIIDLMAEYALSYMCCICCKICGRNSSKQWR